MARVDYDEQAGRYDAARSLPDEAVAVWMATARRHTGPNMQGRPGQILDLGCGTGQWSAPLADLLDADVIGVEPSQAMLTHAAAKPHPRVRLLRGKAEALPFARPRFGAAWLSAVLHHFDDLHEAARQLRRTLEPDAPVLIRGAFRGRGPIGSLDHFFPATLRALDTFPSVDETFSAFEAAGFTSFSVEKVEQLTAHALSETFERVRQRADTALLSITDAEFASGLRAIQDAMRNGDAPIKDRLDLVVVR